MLADAISSREEAFALTYATDLNDIYNCSWGPSDDGKTMEGPDQEILTAFLKGILYGRKGKGNLYIFAAGNGGSKDHCNMDGFANIPLTLTIGAITWRDEFPRYMELCPAMIGVTYSSDDMRMIATIDTDHRCTLRHGGTSAAAPIAASIYSLVLSIRPDLHWRDIQAISVKSLKPLEDHPNEDTALVKYTDRHGFGKFDANAMVETAKNWKSIGPATILEFDTVKANQTIPFELIGLHSQIEISTRNFIKAWNKSQILYYESACIIKADKDIQKNFKLEHVIIRINIRHQSRGDLRIYLESPSKTTSLLLSNRPLDTSPGINSEFKSETMNMGVVARNRGYSNRDNSANDWEYEWKGDGFKNWHFSSLAFWGENPLGVWTITIIDDCNKEISGTLLDWNLIFLGEIKIPPTDFEDSSTLKKEGFLNQVIDSYFPLNPGRIERYGAFNDTSLDYIADSQDSSSPATAEALHKRSSFFRPAYFIALLIVGLIILGALLAHKLLSSKSRHGFHPLDIPTTPMPIELSGNIITRPPK